MSVIIPAFNAAAHLRTAVDSVLAQTCSDWEVIVVDDGSDDRTVAAATMADARVRCLTQPHSGQAAAINRGIAAARGRYLAYLDADDVMSPQKLAMQADVLDHEPAVDLVYTDMRRTLPDGRSEVVRYGPIDPLGMLQKCPVARITVMHRRECLDHVGEFNEAISGSDDWDMWIRMAEQCRMRHLPEVLSEYRIHGGNTSFTRARRLEHFRWTRLVILTDTWNRRGRPWWIQVMIIGARMQWILGRVPWLGERLPRFWGALDRVQALLERVTIGWVARKSPIGGSR